MKMEYFDVNSAKHLQSDMEALMKSGTGDIGIRCEDKEMRVHSQPHCGRQVHSEDSKDRIHVSHNVNV